MKNLFIQLAIYLFVFIILSGCGYDEGDDEFYEIENHYNCVPAEIRCFGEQKLICNVNRSISTADKLIYEWIPHGRCKDSD